MNNKRFPKHQKLYKISERQVCGCWSQGTHANTTQQSTWERKKASGRCLYTVGDFNFWSLDLDRTLA